MSERQYARFEALGVMLSLPFRYFEELCDLKKKAGRALLTWNDLQGGLNAVNNAAQEEHDRE